MNNTMVVKQKKHSKGAVAVLSFLSMLIVSGLPASAVSVLLPTITAEFGLTAPQAASLSAGVALGTACFVFVAGVLMDKMSMRKLIAAATVLAAITVMMRAFVDSYAFLYILFPLYGIFIGITKPGNNKMVSLWFPQEQLFAMNAALIGGGALCYIIGLNFTLPLSNLVGGWRNYFIVLAVVMVIIGILWLVLVGERTSKDAALNKDIEVKAAEKTKFWQNIGYVISSPRVWLITISECCFGGVIQVLIALTTTAIVSSWGLPSQEAAFLSSTANTGSLFGYFILPLIMRKYMKKIDNIWPVSISMVASVILWMIGLSSRNPAIIIPCYAIGGFLNGFGYVGPRTFLMEQPEVAGLRAGTGLGVFNTVVNFAVTGLTTLAGVLSVSMGEYDRAVVCVMAVGFGGPICLFILKALKVRDAKKAKALEQNNSEQKE